AGVLVLARSLGGADEARAPATVELDSQPTGAAVEIDGQAIGSTPLTLTSLAPGATVSIVFKRTGYRAATAQLQVPAPGAAARHVQPLEQSDELVRVRFVSKPPGAEVIRTGQATSIDRTYTPAEVFVEAGKEQRFTLTMPKHVPLVIEPFTPARGARGLEKGGDLASGAPLRLEAPRGGTATVSGAPHCREVALPFDCTLAPGTYVVEYRGPGGAAAQRTVKMGAEDAVETFGSPPPKKK
ncbi:MAG TPA: PEGA domain-containing protein, partial [Kofleriaceae bacterium]|nr:PEGA domain-containing protein [Kofleriaceae bacterium]